MNTLRSNNLCAIRARQTHCKRGHELSEENIYRGKSGNRACKACAIAASKAAYRRKKSNTKVGALSGLE